MMTKHLLLVPFLLLAFCLKAQNFTMRPIKCGMEMPWEITYGLDNFLWATEARGYKVSRINPTTGASTILLDLTNNKNFANYPSVSPQGGLMGMALHPNLLSGKPYVYLAYVFRYDGGSAPTGHFFKTKLVRYTYNSTAQTLTNEEVICDTIPGSNDHNSGRMTIGQVNGQPFLFYSVGDMGAGQFDNKDRVNHAQNPAFYEGKIMRFNLEPDADANATDKWIPNNNPFNSSRQSAVWSIGHRNGQGLVFANGKLYEGEHGPYSDDEINIIESGANYGHPLVCGMNDGNYNGIAVAEGSGVPIISSEQNNATALGAAYRNPVKSFFPAPLSTNAVAYNNTKNNTPPFNNYYLSWQTIAPSGIDYYNSTAIPNWQNSILITSLKRRRVYRLQLDAAGTAITSDTLPFFADMGRFRDLAISSDGTKIYVSCDSEGQTSGPTAGTTIDPPNKGCILEFTYTPNLPDLTLANLTIPTPSVQQGNILNWKVDIKNIGTGNTTANFTVKAYISTDNILSANDVQNGIIPTGNFAAGFSVPQVSGSSTIPTTVPAGQYYLILKVDADNTIAESNENNNVIVSLSTFTVTTPVNNSCRFQDSLQLVSLYNATNGANWRNKWNLSTPINTWIGVTLDANGCVQNLTIFDNLLVGTMPNLSMPNLTSLTINANQLNGVIPNFNLPKLERLDLSINQLSGTIPNFNLPSLKELYLASNKLSGSIPNFNLPNLTGLALSNNQLSGAIPNFNLPNLQQISLYNNQLSGAIPNFSMANLSEIDIATNQLSGTLPNFNLPKLIFLNLRSNQLTGSIPSWNFPLLSVLNLQYNALSGCIPLSLKNLCGRIVDISNNQSLATQDFAAFCSANNTGACPVTSPQYCASKANLPWELWTRNVSFNTINNTSDKYKDYATLGYSDYTNLSTTVTKGQTYPLSISPPVGWTGYFTNVFCRVWIDFNKNNTFEDNEKVLEGTNTNAFTTNVLVPTTAATGAVRMRVSMKQGSYPTACETFEKGEVEDYTITIQNGTVTCNPILKCPNDTTIMIAATATSYCPGITGSPTIDLTGCSFNISNLSNNQSGCLPIGTTPLIWTMNFSSGGFTQCTQNVTIKQQTATLPDLTLANVGLTDPSVQQGRFASFTVDIKNVGTAASSGNFTVKAYISSDQILDANDIQNGVIQANTFAQSFPAGFTLPRVASGAQIPATLPVGVYYLILKADADNQITESNEDNNLVVSASFTVTSSGGVVDNYCTSKSNAPWEMWASEVKFNTINNVSTQNQSGQGFGYTNFTNLSTSVAKGQSYPLSIQAGLSWTGHLPNAFCRVWIDFNNNNTFEANELVLEKTNTNPLTASVLIPTTAVTGSVRMRVSMKWGGYPTACETFDKGEVEDYTINIQGGSDPCLNDITPPVFANCPQNQSRISGSGACETFLWTPPTAADNCSTPSVFFSSKSGNTLNINSSATQAIYTVCQSLGTDSIFYTATDIKGNKSVCAFELKAINACAVVQTTASLPTVVNLTTTNTCAAYKWQVPADYFPCGRPCQYTGWTFISTSPTVNVARVSALCSQIVLDSACFPIGTTEVTYRDYNNNLKTFRVVVANNSSNDIALSIASTPSVYKQYSPLNFTISAKNTGSQAFTNVKIEFKFPTGTTNGGTSTPSVGTWQEWCAGGVQCFTWTIPTLTANATATLNVPVYVLNPTSPMVATAKLLASTPVDNVVANNIATISLNAAPPPARSIQAQPTQLIPIVVDKIAPNPSDGEVVIELESLDEREVQFDFSDAFGKTVKTESRKVEKGTNRVLFEVFELPQGIYFVSPSTNKGKNVPTKFVKM